MEKRHLTLRTQRLVLRAFSEDDRTEMITLLNDEKIKETYMLPDFSDEAEAETMFLRYLRASRSEDRVAYAVTLDRTLIGFVNDCGIADGIVELGYVISPRYRGNGYASEAVAAIIEELFRMGFTAVRAGHFECNTASRRVMEKCGMLPIDHTESITYRGRTHRCLYREIRKY